MEQQIIKCVFCKGTGENLFFKGTCPVCKGKGENEITGEYVTCSSCRGSGQKKGTTLTCYDCGGLGVIPDTRETFRIARKEIGKAKKEMARERAGLTEKGVVNITPKSKKRGEKTNFCQCCGDKVNESIPIKICLDCFGKVKELRVHKR